MTTARGRCGNFCCRTWMPLQQHDRRPRATVPDPHVTPSPTSWTRWTGELSGGPMESGHNMAQDTPDELASCLVDFMNLDQVM